MFSHALVLAFGVFLMLHYSLTYSSNALLDTALNSAISLELSSLKRSIAENSVDFLIEKTVEEQVFFRKDSSIEVVNAVNKRLSEYFHSLSLDGFSFFEAEQFLPKYSSFSDKNRTVFLGFSDEFKANVVKYEHLTFVEFSYVGGFSGRKIVFSKVSPASELYFVIPLGYALRKLVVS